MNARGKAVPASLIGVAFCVGFFSVRPQSASAQDVFYGLTGLNEVFVFTASQPGTIVRTVSVSGLQLGETLAGIDIRPASGVLYGIARVGGIHRLYRIDGVSGKATQVGAAPYSGALTGTNWGMDFSPVNDVLRVVSDAEENLRIHPDQGVLLATDTNITGATSIVGAAYSNNVAGSPVSTAFVIDSVTDRLGRLGGLDGTPSPNGGVVSDIGALGVDTSPDVGFDIAENATAYASLTVAGVPGLYTINLVTGAATFVGAIAATPPIRGLAVDIPPKITINDNTVSEGNTGTSSLVFTVSLSHAAATLVQVRYDTADGTAESVADYLSQSGVLTFALGETKKTISIPINGDARIEPDEAFKVLLTNPINAVITDSEAIGAILSDDVDSDGDGVADTVDNCRNTANADQADANGNSVGDVCEPPPCGACGVGASTMLALMAPALLIFKSASRRRRNRPGS